MRLLVYSCLAFITVQHANGLQCYSCVGVDNCKEPKILSSDSDYPNAFCWYNVDINTGHRTKAGLATEVTDEFALAKKCQKSLCNKEDPVVTG